MSRYLTSHQRELPALLAIIAEAVHERVPPADLKPLVRRIIDTFISEYCANANITFAINSITEMVRRNASFLEPEQVTYLMQFRSYKNPSVCASARTLLNLLRDINPALLEKRLLGRRGALEARADAMR